LGEIDPTELFWAADLLGGDFFRAAFLIDFAASFLIADFFTLFIVRSLQFACGIKLLVDRV